MPRRRAVVIGWLALLLTAPLACEGYLYDVPEGDGDGGGDAPCSPPCPEGWVCGGGVCLSPDDPCFAISCTNGAHCEAGACVGDDLCANVTCSNAGDACQNGICVSGAADNDHDGYPAREDCDDFDVAIHPGLPDLCDGRDEDCQEATEDGYDECPGLCCGEPPGCQECCDGADCGLGDWDCASGACGCSGVVCDDTCHRGGDCCSASDCGTGEWTCDAHQCNCPGTITP